MSERTEVSFDAALMMALRADAQKELDELPTPAQLKERYPDTSRWDARLKAALHKRRPVLKRVLVAAMTLVILTLGALAVSADFRKAVYTMIQKFLPIEMQLTYQVDGEPLEQLPNGYSDHYVPDGFDRDREQEFERAENFLHVYSSKESEKGYTVRCSIIQPGQPCKDVKHYMYTRSPPTAGIFIALPAWKEFACQCQSVHPDAAADLPCRRRRPCRTRWHAWRTDSDCCCNSGADKPFGVAAADRDLGSIHPMPFCGYRHSGCGCPC